MQSGAMLRYALRPLSGPPLVLTLVVSVLATISTAAGWFGLALDGILAAWVWTYVYLLIEYTAHGRPAPVLSMEMTSPWHEPRPLLQALIVIGVAALAYTLELRGARLAAAAVALAALALLPASFAVLAVDGHLLRAIWPPALFAVARGVGWRYPLLVAGTCLAALAIGALAPHLPVPALAALVQFACYSCATSLGGALYERRHELGLEAWEAPERQAVRRDAEGERRRDRDVDEVYALLRVGRRAAALERLGAALGPAPVDPDLYRWFRERAVPWDDRTVAERLTGELVARLIALGRRGEALVEVESWWRLGRQFEPRAARDLDVLKSVARELGHAASLERLSRQGMPASPSGD